MYFNILITLTHSVLTYLVNDMSHASPVVLILGAGPNIGQHVARAFASKGYRVALAARKVREADNTPDQVNLPSDLSDPNAVIGAFSKVEALLGTPSVVIYNGENCLLSTKALIAVSSLLRYFTYSCRCHPKRCKEPALAPAGRFHSRSQHQYNQRVRRGSTSRPRL